MASSSRSVEGRHPRADLQTDSSNPQLDLKVLISAPTPLPDLMLSVGTTGTTAATLKQAVREQLPAEYKPRRMRLIHAGKVLQDKDGLSSALKSPASRTHSRTPSRSHSRTPSRSGTPGPDDNGLPLSSKAKGKTPLRHLAPALQQDLIYIHCSIGDLDLSASELSAELKAATPTTPTTTTTSTLRRRSTLSHSPDTASAPKDASTYSPRGFDRLLSAGFTQPEIIQLRSQFLSLQSARFTPSEMPSREELLDMEEEWMDESQGGGTSLPGDGSRLLSDPEAGQLDDVIWGAVYGFFWPVGSLLWGMKESGVWSQRRQICVATGIAMSFLVGGIRWLK